MVLREGLCQMLVNRHEPYTHSMSDSRDQCKLRVKETRVITSGRTVKVCGRHAKTIDYRVSSTFFKTPDDFFIW